MFFLPFVQFYKLIDILRGYGESASGNISFGEIPHWDQFVSSFWFIHFIKGCVGVVHATRPQINKLSSLKQVV